ncbi:MAG TPA: alpha/beta hydrolase-fold protein [Chryseosolibacter sp.]
MKRLLLAFWLSCCMIGNCVAQNYAEFSGTLQSLINPQTLDDTWNTLVTERKIPLVQEDSVAFLYRGPAKTVTWVGDFNEWGYRKELTSKGTQVPGTDLWIYKTSFPKDARLDYRILLDGSEWILDPHNENQQWSGVGGGSPNSELRMPGWHADPITSSVLEGAKHGKLIKDKLLNSKTLGYQVTYSVYLPTDYDPANKYPVIYVTDGYEYMHERLGNMITILDNLIHLKKINPVVAVFIDHREPINRSNNRRMTELALNQKYLSFMTDEFVPLVEKGYSIAGEPAKRAVIGSSLGGLSAAFFAFSKPDVFGLAGIQSPSFYFRPEIYKVCDNPENPPVKTFMTTGNIFDAAEGAQKMKSILDKNTCNYKYMEVSQSHSWGNWKDTLDDILIYFFPAG